MQSANNSEKRNGHAQPHVLVVEPNDSPLAIVYVGIICCAVMAIVAVAAATLG
jgi:hypothetical protein